MSYRIRDLLITLLPEGADLYLLEPVPDGGVPPEPSSVPPEPPPPPEPSSDDLRSHVELRFLLQVVLSRLGGPLSVHDIRPRTVGELELLESRLNEALTEVRELRNQLS